MRGVIGAIGAWTVLLSTGCSAQATDQPLPVGAPRTLLAADFRQAWPDDRSGQTWVTAEGYQLFARTPGHFVAVRAPVANLPQEIVVEGTFRKVGGPPGGGYGLIVGDQALSAGDGRDQSGEYVVAAVGDRGEIGIWRRAGDHWVDLLPWTRSTAVHTDAASNDLSAVVRGSRLTFSVNGLRVATVDTELKPGGAGIFTGGDQNQVLASNFSVRAPPASQIAAPPVAARSTPSAPRAAPAVGPVAPARDGLADKLGAAQRARELLTGMFEDMAAILRSFAGGPESSNPVTDPAVLKNDSRLLDGATQKAEQLTLELNRLRDGGSAGGG